MTFSVLDDGCKEEFHHIYTAYVRVKQKWITIGTYCIICKQFFPIEEDKDWRETLDEMLGKLNAH